MQPFAVVVFHPGPRWSVEPDGVVTLLCSGASWPEARAVFTGWYQSRGRGEPAFGALVLTTPDSEVHGRDERVS